MRDAGAAKAVIWSLCLYVSFINMHTCFDLPCVLMGCRALLGVFVPCFLPQSAQSLYTSCIALFALQHQFPLLVMTLLLIYPHTHLLVTLLLCPKSTCQTGRAKAAQGEKEGGNRQFTAKVNSLVSLFRKCRLAMN